MTNAVIAGVEAAGAYIRIGADRLQAPCKIPKGVPVAVGDGVLVEKVSGKYMIVAVYDRNEG